MEKYLFELPLQSQSMLLGLICDYEMLLFFEQNYESFWRDKFSNCSFMYFHSIFRHQTLQWQTPRGTMFKNMLFACLHFT